MRDISLSVRAGEILGIAGLVGAGRTETARAIFGMDKKDSGEIYLAGKRVDIRRPLDAIRAGFGFATEDRKDEGLVLTMNVGHNITLATLSDFAHLGKLNLKQERDTVLDYIKRLEHQNALAFAAGAQPFRRQPAEGGAGQVAAEPLEGHHLRRADARHRRGREDRGLQHHQRAHSSGRGGW